MNYRLVRVNTPSHRTRADALHDMAVIIEKGGYWTQRDNPPVIPQGTQIIGMGGHGGRGLFIVGVTRKEKWKVVNDGGNYGFKLPVTWASVVYGHNPQTVNSYVKQVVKNFNPRSVSTLSLEEYVNLLGYVLAGTEINPWMAQDVLEVEEATVA
jgi:hypothetical protein